VWLWINRLSRFAVHRPAHRRERDPEILAATIAALCKRGAHARLAPHLGALSRHSDEAVRSAAATAQAELDQAA